MAEIIPHAKMSAALYVRGHINGSIAMAMSVAWGTIVAITCGSCDGEEKPIVVGTGVAVLLVVSHLCRSQVWLYGMAMFLAGPDGAEWLEHCRERNRLLQLWGGRLMAWAQALEEPPPDEAIAEAV